MTLDVNKEKLTIMGVPFENFEDFDTVWYAVGSSMIEDYKPSVEDIQELKEYVIAKREELNLG
ncbi:TPA: hypothetical protein ACGOSV_000141 [Streptococcus suis]|nr:hypothetical protein [Streptococcus suis]MBY5039338.1 hypothetical protein [Streptococcus suis]MCK3880824.1 hypothetical protein [Streptococcus suis]MDW8682259.1 hypothetical protein [Streptococcus suis]NQK45605.1 hypothetical protein [Streptococcus suis]